MNIRDKLEENYLPYSDEQWQKMEAIIADQEQNKNPAFWWFALSSLGVFCLCIYGVFHSSVISPLNNGLSNGNDSFSLSQLKNATSQNAKSETSILPSEKFKSLELQNKISKLVQPSGHQEFTKRKLFFKNKSNSVNNELASSGAAFKLENVNLIDKVISQSAELPRIDLITVIPAIPLSGLPFKRYPFQFSLPLILNSPKFSNPLLNEIKSQDHYAHWTIYLQYALPTQIAIVKDTKSQNVLSESDFRMSKIELGINNIKNNWIFASGIALENYSHLQEYKKTSINYTFDTFFLLNNPNFTPRPSGRNLALIRRQIDTFKTINENTVCAGCRTKLTYLQVPITLGYQFSLNKNLKWQVLAGVTYSMRINAQGLGVNANEISSAKVSYRKHSSQLQLGSTMRYHFKNNWNVLGGLEYTSSLSTLSNSYNFRQNVFWAKLGLGYTLK